MTPFTLVGHIRQVRLALASLASLCGDKMASCQHMEGGFDHLRRQIQNADIIAMAMERAWSAHPSPTQEYGDAVNQPVGPVLRKAELDTFLDKQGYTMKMTEAETPTPARQIYAEAGEVVGCPSGHGYGTIARTIYTTEQLQPADLEAFDTGKQVNGGRDMRCYACGLLWGMRHAETGLVDLYIAGEGWRRHPAP